MCLGHFPMWMIWEIIGKIMRDDFQNTGVQQLLPGVTIDKTITQKLIHLLRHCVCSLVDLNLRMGILLIYDFLC